MPVIPKKRHSNLFKLSSAICELSESDQWQEAKKEWFLEHVYISDEPETCLCGHTPILECCVLRNQQNDNQVVVGNVCVTKFLEIDTAKVFQAVNRIWMNRQSALNLATVEFFHSKGMISDWERGFYLDTLKKKHLSPKQLAKRVQINEYILQRVKVPA